MKSLIIRSLTGLIYVAVILWALCLGPAWAFPVLCMLFAAPAVCEYGKLCGIRPQWLTVLEGVLAVGLVGVFGFCGLLTGVGALAMAVAIRMAVGLYRKVPDPFADMAEGVMGIIYIALPLGLAATMQHIVMIAVFVALWLNDTGAYCVGCTCGRHRLFERVSPKKSWEGFWGGVCCAAAGCAVLSLATSLNLSITGAILFGVVIAVAGTFGDLVESLLKRTRGVKDSGTLLPGHGGILDRIDSLLLAVPAAWLFLTIHALLK